MANPGRKRYLIVGSNTRAGYRTFIPQLLEGSGRVFIIQGREGTGKATLLRDLGGALADLGYEVEFWISVLNPSHLDGFYLPQKGIAVINGNLPIDLDDFGREWKSKTINLDTYQQGGEDPHDSQLWPMVIEKKRQADEVLHDVGQIQDQIKAFQVPYLRWQKLEELAEKLEKELIPKEPAERHYFSTAFNMDGWLNYVDEATGFCRFRYIVQGPPSPAQPYLLNRLAVWIKTQEQVVEYYHNGLDLGDIEMIIIPAWRVAIIGLNNIQLASRPGDVIINIKDCLGDYVEENLEIKYNDYCRRLGNQLLDAQVYLEKSYYYLKKIKKANTARMDFSLLEKVKEMLKEEILGP